MSSISHFVGRYITVFPPNCKLLLSRTTRYRIRAAHGEHYHPAMLKPSVTSKHHFLDLIQTDHIGSPVARPFANAAALRSPLFTPTSLELTTCCTACQTGRQNQHQPAPT